MRKLVPNYKSQRKAYNKAKRQGDTEAMLELSGSLFDEASFEYDEPVPEDYDEGDYAYECE